MTSGGLAAGVADPIVVDDGEASTAALPQPAATAIHATTPTAAMSETMEQITERDVTGPGYRAAARQRYVDILTKEEARA